MGADVTVVDLDTMEKLQPHLDAKAQELRSRGRKPFMVAPLDPESLSLGAVGYVDAALELDAQLEAAGIEPAAMVVAGANMTPAGLALGMKALGRRLPLVNVAPIKWSFDRATDIARIASGAARRIGLDVQLRPEEIENHDEYIGERYGLVTEGGLEAMKLLAGTEGIILDPVYSAKAMAGLIDQVRKGRWSKDQKILFIHTGGTPAVFAYAQDLGLA
jgi:1-aminocyclopropane-1-carboxylate deaminase/D-cysteine desulfhydrase-like pyridoxal-dependent ACC family enzyme